MTNKMFSPRNEVMSQIFPERIIFKLLLSVRHLSSIFLYGEPSIHSVLSDSFIP